MTVISSQSPLAPFAVVLRHASENAAQAKLLCEHTVGPRRSRVLRWRMGIQGSLWQRC